VSADSPVTALPITVELGDSFVPNQRWASIKLGDVAIFTELVYDTSEHPATKNIVNLFAHRLRCLIEDDQ